MPESIIVFLFFLPCMVFGVLVSWFGIHWYRGGTKGLETIFGEELLRGRNGKNSWEKFFCSVIAALPFIFLITDLSIFKVLEISHATTELLIEILFVPIFLFTIFFGANITDGAFEKKLEPEDRKRLSRIFFLQAYSFGVHLLMFYVFVDPELKALEHFAF
ncbi:hypothetical protein [Olivibacter jilunii]|uniref:hypothetical protein n=1 Tax=Olivibacter jilunii TaxID=985016 RepID=UPI001030ADC0|nr:hypothetical protein [Olivibacter jilunii]